MFNWNCNLIYENEYHFATFDKRQRTPCKICAYPETIMHVYNHLLTNCAPCKFIWGFAYLLIIKTTQRRVAITDLLIFFNQLKPKERSVLSRVNCRDIFSITSTCKLALWQMYYGGRCVTRRKILMKLNKNILILKKCATFRSIRTNIYKIDFIYRDFLNITYQTLIFRQRDTTRMLLNSTRHSSKEHPR